MPYAIRQKRPNNRRTAVGDLPVRSSIRLITSQRYSIIKEEGRTCSRRRHQICVMATQLLAIVAWNIPRRKEQTARPVKDVAAAVAVVTALPERSESCTR